MHGGYSPIALAFDTPYRDYSWMEYLARAGYDVFAMDMTGYGRSGRPHMDDPCNLDPKQQPLLVPRNLEKPCANKYAFELVNSDSEIRRHQCRRRLHPPPARGRQGHDDRLVGRRHPLRLVHGLGIPRRSTSGSCGRRRTTIARIPVEAPAS